MCPLVAVDYCGERHLLIVEGTFEERLLLGYDVEMKEFTCQHMETNTILLYIYSQLRKSGVEDAVEDTDIMVLAAYIAHVQDPRDGFGDNHSCSPCILFHACTPANT